MTAKNPSFPLNAWYAVTHGDRSATVTRWMENIGAPPFWGTGAVPAEWSKATGGLAGSSRPQGNVNQGNRSKGVNGFVLNTVTPETDRACHYFWAFARNYSLSDQRLTHQLREGVASIFHEDELILEAQKKAMDGHPDHQFYNLNIDAGSMWARRLIDGLVAREASARSVLPIRQVG